jgi:outer membrane lipoprotein-sorting protein
MAPTHKWAGWVLMTLAAMAVQGQDVPKATATPKETPQTASSSKASASAPESDSNSGLENVLSQMDKAAANFRTTEANFVWEQYQRVVNDTEIQKGTIYFRRQGKELQMAADVTDPPKYVLFSGGKIDVYEPKIDQVTEYNVAKNRAEVETLLVLGFGGSGHELLKSYDVSYLGSEPVSGVGTEKLQLIPKSVKVRNNVERIVLWIDPARGVSVQQQFFQPGSDYRLTKYADIQINQKIPDNVFKLKTTGKTKVISPQS